MGLKTNVIIRSFEPGDTQSIVRLAEKYASWDATPTTADVQGFHAQNADLFFVAVVEDEIIGFVYGTESKPPQETLSKWRADKVGSVETLAVAQEWRRKGIATLLLNSLFQAFKRKEIDTVILSCPADEVGALKLYEKFGFQTRGYFLRKKI
jgi:ribosomal protein S18 acetylase RimI-like enzyme